MLVETDFTSRRHTLAFEGRRIDLTKKESEEFESWLDRKLAEQSLKRKQ